MPRRSRQWINWSEEEEDDDDDGRVALSTNRAPQLHLAVSPGQDEAQCVQHFAEYGPDIWNTEQASTYNNCYAYAFRNLRYNRQKKPQPGELSGSVALHPSRYTCQALRQRISQDYPDVTFTANMEDPCPCGSYRAYFAIDMENPSPDYHFYRQDRDGTWSSKPGSQAAVNVDARGQLITDPRTADRDYSPGYNYSTDCGFMCIPHRRDQQPR